MEIPPLSVEKERLITAFASASGYAAEAVRLVASPYRISPLGAHIDHQGGPVLGMTIDAYTLLAYVPTLDGRVRLESLNYPGRVVFPLERSEENTGVFWGVYAGGAASALKQEASIRNGIHGLIIGHLPGGGLSSSASVLLAYLAALADANEVALAPWDYVRLTRVAENQFIGLNNGILDQTSIVFGQPGHLLHIDTLKPHVTAIPQPVDAATFQILVAYSGYSRELTTTGYNARVAECREAARCLAELDGGFEANRLMDISPKTFATHGAMLPGHLHRRARHFFSEKERVRKGVDAWQRGAIADFGELMRESCRSSMTDYECGSPPIYDLQAIMSRTKGVFGSRFSGGGFGGCVVGLVAPEHADDAVPHILETYQKQHPEVADKANVFLARSVTGLGHA